MSRTQAGAELNSVVWQNIDKLLRLKGIERADFKRIIPRNKNTFTNWFTEPRPMLKIADLAEIARALEIPPEDLLRRSRVGTSAQLELPFDESSTKVVLEIESTGVSVVLRPANGDPHTAVSQRPGT